MKTLAVVICMTFTFFSGVALAHDPGQHVSDANLVRFGIEDDGGGLYIYKNTISCKRPMILKRLTVNDLVSTIRSSLRKDGRSTSQIKAVINNLMPLIYQKVEEASRIYEQNKAKRLDHELISYWYLQCEPSKNKEYKGFVIEDLCCDLISTQATIEYDLVNNTANNLGTDSKWLYFPAPPNSVRENMLAYLKVLYNDRIYGLK